MTEPKIFSGDFQPLNSSKIQQKDKKVLQTEVERRKKRLKSVSAFSTSTVCESTACSSIFLEGTGSQPAKQLIGEGQEPTKAERTIIPVQYPSISALPQGRPNGTVNEFLNNSHSLLGSLGQLQHLLHVRDNREKEFEERKSRIKKKESDGSLGKRTLPSHSVQTQDTGDDLLLPSPHAEDQSDKWSFLL